MVIPRVVELDIFECDSDCFIGSLRAGNVRCNELLLYGYVDVKGLMVVDKLVIVGGGYINMLTCSEALIITRGKPLYIDKMYCYKAFIIGAKHPVLIREARIVELNCSNTLINQLKAKKMILNKRCGVRILKECSEIVFNDPHCWFEVLEKKPVNTKYNYSLS